MAASQQVPIFVLEDRATPTKDSLSRALYSAVVTLTLGVLGSTILPVPYAFSKLGILPGALTMLVVAFVNDCTCCMLVRAAATTGRVAYEELAEWAGGKKARVVTQVSLILLLYGTLCGGLAFLSDVAHMMMLKGIPAAAGSKPPPPASIMDTTVTATYLSHTTQVPMDGSDAYRSQTLHSQMTVQLSVMHAARMLLATVGDTSGSNSGWWQHALGSIRSWLSDMLSKILPVLQSDGRPLMLFVVATVLYPLCLQRHIREFEKAATVGVVVVVALMALIVYKAVASGFPAVAAGQLPVWGFHAGGGAALPEAFAILGFAFYMQPMLMPLVAEMPGGVAGARVSERAVHLVLFGVACAAYGTVGVFGAATYGDQTQSNIMVNDLLPGQPAATLLLYGCLLVYLCCGMVTTHYALRASLEVLLTGAMGQLSTWRRVILTTCILLAALAVACTFPTYAERIFALTGCTAVCLVCYCIPVYIHLKLQKRLAEQAALVEAAGGKQNTHGSCGSDNAISSSGITLTLPHSGTQERRVSVACLAPSGLLSGSQPGTSELAQPLLLHQENHGLHEENGNMADGRAAHLQALLNTHHGLWGTSSVKQTNNLEGCMQVYALPAFIILVGVGCSLAGLWVGFMDVYHAWQA